MADSETQQVARREDKRLVAEAKAIIASGKYGADSLEVLAAREVLAFTPPAFPTVTQWLGAIYIAVLLANKEDRAIIANSQLKRAETPSAAPPKKRINYIITKALSDLHGSLPRDSWFAVVEAMAKHVDFSRDNVEQSPLISE